MKVSMDGYSCFQKSGEKPKKKSQLQKRTPGVHGWFGLLTSAMLNAADPTASQPRTLIMQRVASDKTRARIPVLHRQGYSVKDICHLLAIKKTLMYKVLAW